jgi:phosphate transport system permease protein
MNLRRRPLRRRLRNGFFLSLSVLATAFGLGWLALILGTLIYKGFSGIDLKLFTDMTPPPGEDGGLLNPIVGSLLMNAFAVAVGTPIAIFAGTYLAEYGRHARLSSVVRFVNDILLSAPSIVLGLFIYEVIVIPMGHFSAWAGAAVLATIVIPVVVHHGEHAAVSFRTFARQRGRSGAAFARQPPATRRGAWDRHCARSRSHASPARRRRFLFTALNNHCV